MDGRCLEGAEVEMEMGKGATEDTEDMLMEQAVVHRP